MPACIEAPSALIDSFSKVVNVPVPEIPAWQFYLRLLVIVLMLTAAYIMSEKADPFFYQGF